MLQRDFDEDIEFFEDLFDFLIDLLFDVEPFDDSFDLEFATDLFFLGVVFSGEWGGADLGFGNGNTMGTGLDEGALSVVFTAVGFGVSNVAGF